MKKISLLFTFVALFLLPATAHAANYYVSTIGSDSNIGSQSQPWKTIGKATSSLSSGDSAVVLPGNYNEGINISKPGLTITASGKVTTEGVYVKGDFNTVSGFTITDRAANAGIEVHGDHNLFEKNDISHTKQDGVWFFGSYNTFRSNYIHDILDPSISGDPHVDCFQTWQWDRATTNGDIFEKNICDHTRSSGSNQIVEVEDGTNMAVTNLIFRNNIFIMHDSGYSPMNFDHVSGYAGISGIQILNNTFYNTTGAGESALYPIGVVGSSATNNVAIGYSRFAILTGGSLTANNNIISGPYGMVDYPNLDFHLTNSSPLIDKGIADGVGDDFDGVSRPQGAGYDIGAYEFSSLAVTPIPAPKLGDLNSDGKVDNSDYQIFISDIGKTGAAGFVPSDVNKDGKVDIFDYNILVANYGK